MSNQSQADSSPHKEVELVRESAKFDDSSHNSPESQLQSEASKNLSSPPNSKNPTGQFRDSDITSDNRTSDKLLLKGYVSQDVHLKKESDILPEVKNNKTKNQTSETQKDVEFPPRYFIQDKDGNIIERQHTREQPSK